ncbi:MAG TPA: hypothetical protein VFU23_14305 [Gemmatimonadales bacterium]|nr:hypothetical protein [Gemmatimonadales bacterium]
MTKSPTQLMREREELHRQFPQLFDACVREFYRSDPIRLAPHAPLDEYEPQVITVLPRLPECTGQPDVQRVLHEEFVTWFGADVAGPISRYSTLSYTVWALYQRASNP